MEVAWFWWWGDILWWQIIVAVGAHFFKAIHPRFSVPLHFGPLYCCHNLSFGRREHPVSFQEFSFHSLPKWIPLSCFNLLKSRGKKEREKEHIRSSLCLYAAVCRKQDGPWKRKKEGTSLGPHPSQSVEFFLSLLPIIDWRVFWTVKAVLTSGRPRPWYILCIIQYRKWDRKFSS